MITPTLAELGAVLAAVKHATRRLRRWPAASLDSLRPMPRLAAVIDASLRRGGGWRLEHGVA